MTEAAAAAEEAAASVFNLEIESLIERPQFANVLVYAESGAGKTVFASTFPRPILWLEAEGGTLSIPDKSGIDIVKVKNLETFRNVAKFLQSNPERYASLVLDSWSESSAALLTEIMQGTVKLDKSRDVHSPQFKEFGKLTGIGREIIRAYRDLPLHFCVTALTREDTDELTGRVKVRPKTTPTLADELPTFMDAVLYLYTKNMASGETDGSEAAEEGKAPGVVRNALLMPTGKYVAKLRAPDHAKVPAFITDPDFDKVAKLMHLDGVT